MRFHGQPTPWSKADAEAFRRRELRERARESGESTCGRCGSRVAVRGIRQDGWIDLEPHSCTDSASGAKE